MDFVDCFVKLDHSVGSPDPLPNFRQTPGFPVYSVGQPTEAGFAKLAGTLPKEKTIWFNLREEPVVYVNGEPCAPRKKDAPHENVTLGVKTAELDSVESKFLCEVEKQGASGSGQILLHKDEADQENPMDRTDTTSSVKIETAVELHKLLLSLSETAMKDLVIIRSPFQEERPLPESCFDQIVSALATESPSTTQCIFSSQKGQGRSTLGAVIASIVKATQMIVKLNQMVAEGMAERSWADSIIKTKFEGSAVQGEDQQDAFLRGEFEVIKELVVAYPDAKDGKILADKMIDINGVPPEGAGIQNLRKCIIQTKYKYDASTEDKQVVWKRMIINFIERYFYLICFAMYAREASKEAFKKPFTTWMDEHKDLRDMIEKGKDKLEWYRRVDENKVSNLKGMVSGSDYKEKLGTLVSHLYKLAFQTYSDFPRGPIRDNLMRKLACKTLLEILPQDVTDRVHKEIQVQKLPMDFDTVMGLVVA